MSDEAEEMADEGRDLSWRHTRRIAEWLLTVGASRPAHQAMQDATVSGSSDTTTIEGRVHVRMPSSFPERSPSHPAGRVIEGVTWPSRVTVARAEMPPAL